MEIASSSDAFNGKVSRSAPPRHRFPIRPQTRFGRRLAARYGVDPALADLVAALAGYGSEAI